METLTKIAKPIMGQEAICPDGLGRVVGFSPGKFIKVDTYVGNRGCEWAPHNVELIDPRNHNVQRSVST